MEELVYAPQFGRKVGKLVDPTPLHLLPSLEPAVRRRATECVQEPIHPILANQGDVCSVNRLAGGQSVFSSHGLLKDQDTLAHQ
jgi:hypothetical protein